MILENIHTPADVKALDREQLEPLCRELRQFLVEHVSKTGGHLASNLGAVELTVAIHRVFDTSKDRLVFDVGHQCYVHKALTGRQALFDTLRQLGGLSGFPKPRESEHDAFIAGHASNSVSVALGMARARTLQHLDYSVLALIGDGALTGGLAYEGLNNAGASGEPLIVLLNDNGMSINPNVGAVDSHLSQIRSKPAYYHFKKWYRGLFGQHPMENPLYRFNHKVKTSLKKALWPGSTLFEDMGFTYLGPIDGHDLDRLVHVLAWARELQCPVVVHVKTVKGRGYSFAEQNPDKFHGVGPFDPETGLVKKSGGDDFSAVFGRTLAACAAEDGRVCAITAAMADGTGLAAFARRFPARYHDVGIAEEHAVTMAAGLAAGGFKPYFAVYSTFLQRAFDEILHDVCIARLPVTFLIDRAGAAGADGVTHQGVFDLSYLSMLPGMTVCTPKDGYELGQMLEWSLSVDFPLAIRYPKCYETGYDTPFVPFAWETVKTAANRDYILAAGSRMLDEAVQCDANVIHVNTVKPLDTRTLDAIPDGARVVTMEDNVLHGGFGRAVLAYLNDRGSRCRVINLGYKDAFIDDRDVRSTLRDAGLTAENVKNLLK